MDLPEPSAEAVAALAPHGVLRAAINTSNFLLVTGSIGGGQPSGVSPDVAASLAQLLGVELQLLSYQSPAAVADAATSGAWDIGNIGAEPQRANFIDFTAAYAEIEATYLVAADSDISTLDEVDQSGRTVVCKARSAYGLWLERNLIHANLYQVPDHDRAWSTWLAANGWVLGALRPWLLDRMSEAGQGVRLLDGRFTAVQQAIGTPTGRPAAGIGYLRHFVEWAKTSGMIAASIAAHGVDGRLSVASPHVV